MNATNEQIAEHQALFRAENEHAGAQPERLGAGAALIFHCECADLDCSTRLRLTRAQYEAVRAHPARFIVAPGHVIPQAERVVEEHEGYLVVQKNEDVRDVLERTDPRAADAG
jgi:hypothetical protein